MVALALTVLGCDPAPKPVDTSGTVVQTVDPDAPVAVVTHGTTVDVITPRAVRSKYVPLEGEVAFNTERYHQAVVDRDSLLRMQSAPKDSTASAVPELRIAASVDSLTRVINDPERYGILTVKTFGTCLRPMAGIGWNGRVDGFAGIKVAFWNRTGVVEGMTGHQAGAGLSYRLDGLAPFLRNTEVMGLYGVPYEKENGGLFVGLAVGL
jgi:hypothetical protein